MPREHILLTSLSSHHVLLVSVCKSLYVYVCICMCVLYLYVVVYLYVYVYVTVVKLTSPVSTGRAGLYPRPIDR